MLIEFGEINCKSLFLLFYPLFIHFRKLINDSIKDNFFFDLFRFYLSFLLSTIFLIIIKKRTRLSSAKMEVNNNNDNNSIANKDIKESIWINPLITKEEMIKRKKKIQKCLFIIALTIIGLMTNLFYIIYRLYYNNKNFHTILDIGKQSIGSLFEIIYFLIFGNLILKNKLYKHHFLSLIIMFFNLIILIISFSAHYKSTTLKVIFYFAIYNCLFCLSYILGKKYLNIFYIQPYDLMVKIGLISLILLIIYDVFAFFFFGENNTHIHGIILGFKNNLFLSFIFLFLFDILLYFITNLGIWLIIYYLTPFHLIISESFSEYLIIIYYAINPGEKIFDTRDMIIFFSVYIINIFFSLVFNEIIILNFWSLNYNTSKYIKIREKDELNLMSKNPNDTICSKNL